MDLNFLHKQLQQNNEALKIIAEQTVSQMAFFDTAIMQLQGEEQKKVIQIKAKLKKSIDKMNAGDLTFTDELQEVQNFIKELENGR